MNTFARHVGSGASRSARIPRPANSLGPSTLFARRNTTDSTASTSAGALTPHEGTIDSGFPADADSTFYDLMKPSILMDLQDTKEFPPSRRSRFRNRVIVRNDPSMFLALQQQMKKEASALGEGAQGREDRSGEDNPLHFLHLSTKEIRTLFAYPIVRRKVTQQTGKGKVHKSHVAMVVGNQNGLVGIGEGKSEERARAHAAALKEAVRNMDYVDRFENRTVWSEMESKFGSTRVILRPRPVGFGLHCNPNIYHILKAAGIRDVSAKVWGSRNPLQVVKALTRMLMPGNAPSAMGNGIGGKGRRMDKLPGIRGKDDIERERGRKLVPLRL